MSKKAALPLTVLLLCGALLCGCGQKGDLYVPSDTAQDTEPGQHEEDDENDG